MNKYSQWRRRVGRIFHCLRGEASSAKSDQFSIVNYCALGRGGYVLLITAIFVTAIASSILSSLTLLGTNAGITNLSVEQSTEALGLAQGCIEYALQKLRDASTYGGNEIRAVGPGTCEILTVGGIGNNNRTICSEGVVGGDVMRRMEIVVQEILPKTKISSWQEVQQFTLCQ